MKLRESNLGFTRFGEGELNQGFHVGVFLTLKCQLLSRVKLFATPWTVAHQARLSMEFSRQEYWSGMPFPTPGNLLDSGIKPESATLAGGFFTTEPPGNPSSVCM